MRKCLLDNSNARHSQDWLAKQNDDEAIVLIKGLDMLSHYACSRGLVAAANIISSAKEDMAYWVAQQDFNERKLTNSCKEITSGSVHFLFDMLSTTFLNDAS